jgi:spore maturation protein CgeB
VKIVTSGSKALLPLREALEAEGCITQPGPWKILESELPEIAAVVLEVYDAIRNPMGAIRLKQALRQHGIPLIGIDRDAPWHKGVRPWRLRLFNWLQLLDVYATHSLQGADQFAAVPVYFPNAAWVSAYNLSGSSLQAFRAKSWYRVDVSFVGNLNADKYPEHRLRAAFFSELARQLDALGITHSFCNGDKMSVPEQVDLIQHSRININYGAACDDGRDRSWGLPERCYGVPACGGFLLSDERRHAADDFVPGREWNAFTDLDHCVEMIRYYLAKPEQARDIAEAAHARVMRDHTYTSRARQLIQLINDSRARQIQRLQTK